MNFVKIGKRIVNLEKVESLYFQPQGGMNHDAPCVVIDFGGADNYIAIYKRSEPETFSQLMTWMDEQPALLSEQWPYVPDETGTHPPNCSCPWCLEG